VLISHNHFTDRIYGRRVAEVGFQGHVGMIASKRKEKTVRRLWREEDGLDPEFVAHVVSPLGIPIGARTPPEIAVSIVGWIVKTVREP
jgi:xanthine/CO dehydrogenase XdhC/CoxF family maturation factor